MKVKGTLSHICNGKLCCTRETTLDVPDGGCGAMPPETVYDASAPKGEGKKAEGGGWNDKTDAYLSNYDKVFGGSNKVASA